MARKRKSRRSRDGASSGSSSSASSGSSGSGGNSGSSGSSGSSSKASSSRTISQRISGLTAPQPIERLAALRVLAPLAILGFLANRMWFADHWLGRSGFGVPRLGYTRRGRQPIYLPRLPDGAAWAVAATLCVSGLALSVGALTRVASVVFFAALAYVSLADRLSSFTVNKLGTTIAFGLIFTPCGARYSVDASLAARRDRAPAPPTQVSWGNVRFFQALLVSLYFTSGIVKARGDWLDHGYVLWSHLHDSYQTSVSLFLANLLPKRAWTVAQAATLLFEIGAPLWFAMRRTRTAALLFGFGLHVMIGACFGPVIYFALLMMVLLLSGFAPHSWLTRLLRPFDRPAAKTP